MRLISCIVDAAYEDARVYDVLRGQLGASDGSVRRAKHVEGGLQLDGQPAKANDKVKAGQQVALVIDAPGLPGSSTALAPEAGPVRIVHADADLLVVDKPAGLVMYPSPGHPGGTLANRLEGWLAGTDEGAVPGERLGGSSGGLQAVHRLDAGTSGLVAFARNSFSKERLQAQLHSTFTREYLAVCRGVPPETSGQVDAPIGLLSRSPNGYGVAPEGKPSLTRYRAVGTFTASNGAVVSLLRLRLETGRTHQIRIHLAHIGCPLVGDAVYGPAVPAGGAVDSAECFGGEGVPASEAGALAGISRPALHSWRMSFVHPVSGEHVSLEAPLPADMRALLPEGAWVLAGEGDRR